MGSTAATVRALPALFRVSFAEAVAYRAEFLFWILSTTMPLIMLALWSAVARDGPVGRFGPAEFTAYFLATFLVRQLTGSWAAWQMNFEIRNGTLSTRLLRPIHPMVAYAVENLAAQPLRLVAAVPAAALGLFLVGRAMLPQHAAIWLGWAASMLGAWLITFLASFAIGALAFYSQSSLKVMDVWLTLFFVLSGYLVPVELFPPLLRAAIDWLPFRYQIGFPVELLTSAHAPARMVRLLLAQWAWVALLFGAASLVWTRGLRRFAAFGS